MNGTSKAVAVENLSLVHTAQILSFHDDRPIVTGGIANLTERVLAVLRGACGPVLDAILTAQPS